MITSEGKEMFNLMNNIANSILGHNGIFLELLMNCCFIILSAFFFFKCGKAPEIWPKVMSPRTEDDCGKVIGVWLEGTQHGDFSHMEWPSPDVYGLVLREGDDIGAYGNCPT